MQETDFDETTLAVSVKTTSWSAQDISRQAVEGRGADQIIYADLAARRYGFALGTPITRDLAVSGIGSVIHRRVAHRGPSCFPKLANAVQAGQLGPVHACLGDLHAPRR